MKRHARPPRRHRPASISRPAPDDDDDRGSIYALPLEEQWRLRLMIDRAGVLRAGLVATCPLAQCRRARRCVGPAEGYPRALCDWPCVAGPDVNSRQQRALDGIDRVIEEAEARRQKRKAAEARAPGCK